MANEIVDYIVLPDNLKDLYFRILKEFSNSSVKDLSIDSESNPVRLFNMFESAIAAYKLNNQKLYKLLIGYIVINLKPIDKMKIFKNANGLWNVDGSIIPAGTLILEPVANSNTVKFLTLNFQVVKQETIDNLLKEDGTPYGTYSAFELATKDFFVKAPIGGADITQLTNDVAALTIKLNNLEIKGVTELLNKPNGIAGLDAAKKLANDIIRTDFRMSQGYIFDGMDDYLTVAHNDKLNFGTDGFSIQVKMVLSPSSRDERIIQKVENASPYTGISFVKATDNILRFRLFKQSSATSIDITTITLSNTELNLFCIRNNGLIKIYNNGILIKTTTETLVESISNSFPLIIGASQTGQDVMSGKVSLFRLFNRALSQSDVTYYENGGRPDLQRLLYSDDKAGAIIFNSTTPYVNNEVGKGNSVLMSNETEPYYRCTPDSGKTVSISKKFDTQSNKRLRISNYFRQNTGASVTIRLRFLEESIFKDIIAPNGVWTKIDYEGYGRVLTIYCGNAPVDMVLDYKSTVVVQVGCVLELLPQNALPDRWLESQNGLDAITSGNPAINTETPITDTQIVDNITNNIATGVTNRDYTLPAGYLVDSVCVKSTVSLTALQLVNVSTSETLLTGKTVSSTAGKHLPITADQSSPTTNTTIRLNATGNTGLGFNIVINIKKCL